MGRKIGATELMDIVVGATFLGTGGGGSPESGKILINGPLARKEIDIVSSNEVEDDANVVVIAGMGSPEALLKKGFTAEAVKAFEVLERFSGKKFDYVIPIEVGGFNSLSPMTVTVEKGIPTVDADGAGRAIPELQQTMFSINKIPLAPASLADAGGSSAVLDTDDPFLMEDLGRAVTTVLGMQAGLACHIMSGADMRRVVIPDTLTKAEAIGRAIRKAKESGEDPVKSVTVLTEGFELIRGTVVMTSVETRGGFDFGKVVIEGTDEYKGQTIHIEYKNENMMAWRDDKLLAVVPDSICYIALDGDPLTNADVKENEQVAIIGMKAPSSWRIPEGYAVFERVLKAMGYEGGYKPIEVLNA